MIQALRWGIAPLILNKIGSMLDTMKEPHYLLAFFLVASSILFLFIPFHIPLPIWLPLLLFYLILASIITTTADSFATKMAVGSSNRGMIITSYTMVVDLGAALGPILGFALAQEVGIPPLFWLCSILCGLLAFRWLFPPADFIQSSEVRISKNIS